MPSRVRSSPARARPPLSPRILRKRSIAAFARQPLARRGARLTCGGGTHPPGERAVGLYRGWAGAQMLVCGLNERSEDGEA
jgi:hypothetical protein